MDFAKEVWAKNYAPNTRETFRRQVLHQFVQANLAEYNPFEPHLATNSPRAHYAISDAALEAVQAFGTPKWKAAAAQFSAQFGQLQKRYAAARDHEKVPVTLPDGKTLLLSPGKHNEVQRAIIEEFAARFAPGSQLLYVGDTDQKDLVMDKEVLEKIGIPITQHDKLPDVVLYSEKKNWIYLIEAVTSHGPVSPKRIVELEKLLAKCTAGQVYVSAFPDMSEFKKHAPNIAWETEVWLADMPGHLIHFNGDKFFGPRKKDQ